MLNHVITSAFYCNTKSILSETIRVSEKPKADSDLLLV